MTAVQDAMAAELGEDENGFPMPRFFDGSPVRQSDDGHTWIGEDWAFAGTIAVENFVVSDRGTYAMSVCVRRRDGHRTTVIPHLVLDAQILESAKDINVWFGKNCAMHAAFKPKNTVAVEQFKAWLYQQPKAGDRVRDVSILGYHDDLDCWFGQHGFVDHSSVALWQEPYSNVYGKGGLHLVRRSRKASRGAPILEVGPAPANPRAEWSKATMRLLGLWRENLGVHMGALAFGWYHAAIWRHVFTQKERNFPHLYLTGRFQSGKDTMAAILNTAFGVPANAVTNAGKTTTDKWVRNQLGEVGNWPLWLNELRNTDEFLHLCTQIRTSFDLQGSAVLQRSREDGEIEFPNRRSMLLVGEDVLGGDSERSRYLLLTVRPPAKRGIIGQVEQAASQVAMLLPWMLAQKTVGEEMLACYDHWLPLFMETGCDQRRARAFSLAMCGLAHTFSLEPHKDTSPLEQAPEELVTYARRVALQNMEAALANSAMEKFTIMLEISRAMGDLNDADDNPIQFSRRVIKPDQTVEIWLWAHGLHDALGRRGNKVPHAGVLYNEIEALPGYKEKKRVPWGDMGARTCHIFEDNINLPSWIRDTSTVTLKSDGSRDPAGSSPTTDDLF